ncbi:glucocorticoid modulatory element-binding protein 2 [Syngnathoides biaculeatus]|uniref:glucocorticoid modulatory element-binding protein 2 n=1 Tax=Syngnathoides biaculeatus TaxID=300417 RepID=UPI002ADD4C88|nr:glucocorticoid modulatory element-binding protein 2 [Syngnathoides biaculeatus]XP_061697103.1 glucocorticoid modulatory element-binding protein 2 [Syngnathoides biaculeatus]XP_061697111.1 glucocorticoid modulatory element-binding protein 2 [Syngnathoides biaculeatus]
MASSEVKMQEMSEVVIVTMSEEAVEGLSSVVEEEKAVLVTTQLSHEHGEQILTVTQVEPDDTSKTDSLCNEEAVIVKLTDEVDVEADVFYPITCGDATATLVWKKFVCPGINVKCVQFNDQLISPKEFVCLAGKSTLKDWKRAIRLNGTMLRKIMDSGELEFYHHAKICSNTCRSTKIDLLGNKVATSSDQSADLAAATSSTAYANGEPSPEASSEPSEWVTAVGEDAVSFWRAVKDAGLLEEVIEDFQKELQEVLKGLHERVCEPSLQVKDAALLNSIVHNFGMLDLVKKVLSSHKSQMDHYREQYTNSLAALEQQCDEHRKRARELKSKSQHLNNVLMNFTPGPKAPAPKRCRMSRAVSTPASISPAPAPVTLPLNQLSAVPLAKLLTVTGAPAAQNLGSYTLLTSPLNGSELVADASNLTVLSTLAGQEATSPENGAVVSSTFVKMVTPQFQLVTLPSTMQGLAAAQPVDTIAVVDATATTADVFLQGVQAGENGEGQHNEVRGDDMQQLVEQQ